MIADVLNFLRRHLDERLRLTQGGSQDDTDSDRVVFVDGDKLEPLSLALGAVSLLLINLEEERINRAPDLRSRHADDGTRMRVQPDIRLSLHLLFAARFKRYDVAWNHLSAILEYLQTTPVFEATNAPDLPPGVEMLVAELVTPDFARQNEIWGALRISAHPALLYRIKLVAYRDRHPVALPAISDAKVELGRAP